MKLKVLRRFNFGDRINGSGDVGEVIERPDDVAAYLLAYHADRPIVAVLDEKEKKGKAKE